MNYPKKYSNDLDYQWEIHASIGYYVTLTFEDFQLESSIFDYVDLSENKRHIAKLGSTDGLFKTYRSFASSMLMKFHSDPYTVFRGFKASYKQGGFQLISELLILCLLFVIIIIAQYCT